MVGLGWVGLDGSLGLVEYRAPDGANNKVHFRTLRHSDAGVCCIQQ